MGWPDSGTTSWSRRRVPYGSSGEHEGFAGTLSIGQEATRLLLVELVRSASRAFRRVLLVVGHGGNAEPVQTDDRAADGTRLSLGHVVASARPLRPRTRVVAPPSGTDPMDRLRVLTGAATVHEPPTVVRPVDASEAADVLLDFLRLRGYLERHAFGSDPEPSR